MLTKLFNSNSVFSYGILIILAIILWAKAFVNIPVTAESVPASPLYHFISNWINDLSVIRGIIALSLIVFEAILINHILSDNDLIPRNSLIAAFIFIIINSLFINVINLNPVLIANLFIITALWLVLKLYEDKDAYSTAFNVGTLISVASMFYFPSIIFVFLVWVVFIVYRLYKWREWFIVLLGLIIPYVFLGTYYFWNDCLSTKISIYKEALLFINFNDFPSGIYIKIVFIFLSLLMLLSVSKLLAVINEKAIKMRKFLSFMIWFFIFDFICLNLSNNYGTLGFLMMNISVSVLLSLFLSYSKKTKLVEGTLIILLVILITGRLGFLNF
ncbi:MAG: hypothetical protein HGB12_04715 [Bacteroidetes bacterium]|nr:hypothetical protein [Bacteroidota bacterium]